jgi:hypothetical protein
VTLVAQQYLAAVVTSATLDVRVAPARAPVTL